MLAARVYLGDNTEINVYSRDPFYHYKHKEIVVYNSFAKDDPKRYSFTRQNTGRFFSSPGSLLIAQEGQLKVVMQRIAEKMSTKTSTSAIRNNVPLDVKFRMLKYLAVKKKHAFIIDDFIEAYPGFTSLFLVGFIP